MPPPPPEVPEKKLLPSAVYYRNVTPTDIAQCYALERTSYPKDEAASKNTLQYRQHHAAPYFRCAILKSEHHHLAVSARTAHAEAETPEKKEEETKEPKESGGSISLGSTSSKQEKNSKSSENSSDGNKDDNDEDDENEEDVEDDADDDEDDTIVGFICSTRCHAFEHEAMYTHQSDGPLLAIHSVVAHPDYRRQGLATAMMKNYLANIRRDNCSSTACITKVVLMAKAELLTFYVDCGFRVMRPSSIVHGADRWYDLEYPLFNESDGNPHKLMKMPSMGYSGSSSNSAAKSGYPCFIVDSFASERGAGNPAAVVILPKGFHASSKKNRAWCQMVAAEFNLSETAFAWPRDQTPFLSKVWHWNIRYYTPKIEVALCGHATLASAAILYQNSSGAADARRQKRLKDTKIVFHAMEDELVMQLAEEGELATPAPPSRAVSSASIFDESTASLIAPLSTVNSSTSQSSSALQSSTSAMFTSMSALPPVIPPVSAAQTSRIGMTFPSKPPREIQGDEQSVVRKMLLSAFSDEFPLTAGHVLYMGLADTGDVLIELTPEAFMGIGYDQLNYDALLEWDGYYRGVIICCVYQRPSSTAPPGSTESSTNDDGSNGSTGGGGGGGGDTSALPTPPSPSRASSSASIRLERTHSAASEQSDETPSGSGSGEDADFLSRFFGPKAGIDEDPVTGSAHCVLAPYFSQKLGGKLRVVGRQASERGGTVECRIGDDETEVTLIGSATTTVSGTLWM